ncbi:hypothetical protein SNE40_002616 [Patella caerulea]|uniref:Uncharacterized protein n=1 Tax=Patella caerulea TaxID=87958 RepID=A0AAN8KE67_PATCE
MYMNGQAVTVQIVDKSDSASQTPSIKVECTDTETNTCDELPLVTDNENNKHLELWDDLESFIDEDLLNLAESFQTELMPQENDCKTNNLTVENKNTRKRKISEISDSVSNSDEDIYSLCLSDSGVGSDIEALSPQSDSSSSVIGEDIWEESFGELFPGLFL